MSRLLIVCRHFWPVSNATAYRIAELVRFLQRRNIDAQILTTRWHSSWPVQSTFHETPLTRILPASTTAWNESHFQRNLWTWVEKSCKEFDVCFVDSLELICTAKLSSALKEKVILLRVDLNNDRDRDALNRPSATLQWLASSSRVRFLVQNAAEHRLLLGAGIASAQIVRLEPIVAPIQRNDASKSAARAVLSSVGIDYGVPDRFPLVVLLFDGDDYNIEHSYLKALTGSFEEHATFRAWVFGSNEQMRRHYAYLRDMGLHHDILLHSSFDDLNTVYDAADFVIAPNRKDARAFYYPLAIARGVATPLTINLESKTREVAMNGSLGELVNSIESGVDSFKRTFADFASHPQMFEMSAAKLHHRVQWPTIEKYNAETWQTLLSLT